MFPPQDSLSPTQVLTTIHSYLWHRPSHHALGSFYPDLFWVSTLKSVHVQWSLQPYCSPNYPVYHHCPWPSVSQPPACSNKTIQNWSLLSRPHCHNSNLRSSKFSHSFSIGAATTSAKAGIPSWLIKVLGHWCSDCYERYIRTPHTSILAVPKLLADTDSQWKLSHKH